jgi:uncharacterized protein
MIQRLINLSKTYSLFLFGARNTGKSHLVQTEFKAGQTLYIDLLDPMIEAKYARNPMILSEEVSELNKKTTHVVIDEVQKLPLLLNVVHKILEEHKKIIFILTGSSARKLKQAGVDLLAGRAFVYHLYPFSFLELKSQFNLEHALQFGLLPKLLSFSTDADKNRFLLSYTQTYLKEEIWAEHIIRKLEPFRRFLEVAAQANTKVINCNNIANDVGADNKTVENYFTILEDTLVGYMLQPFHHSFRKRLSQKPKFYFIDIGLTRALANLLDVIPKPGTHYYGEVFEQFIILECVKLNSYYELNYRFSYLATKDGAEVDLVVERPNKPLLLIEIKSSTKVTEKHLRHLKQFHKELPESEAIVLCQERQARRSDGIRILPWKEGIIEYLTKK